MGFIRKASKAIHPVRTAKRSVKRAVIPRPVRKAMRVEYMVTSPVSYAKGSMKGAAIGALDDAVTPSRKGGRKKSASQAAGTYGDGRGAYGRRGVPLPNVEIDALKTWFVNYLRAYLDWSAKAGIELDAPPRADFEQTALDMFNRFCSERGHVPNADQRQLFLNGLRKDWARAVPIFIWLKRGEAEGRLSPDGNWVWNGSRWSSVDEVVKAGSISADGWWYWDGSQWAPTP